MLVCSSASTCVLNFEAMFCLYNVSARHVAKHSATQYSVHTCNKGTLPNASPIGMQEVMNIHKRKHVIGLALTPPIQS